MEYPYKWSVNLSFTSEYWLSVIIWRGNTRYRWEAKQPLTVEKQVGIYASPDTAKATILQAAQYLSSLQTDKTDVELEVMP